MKNPVRTATVRTIAIGGVVACTALVGLGAGPAFADTTPAPTALHTLAEIQAAGATHTSARIAALTKEIDAIATNTHLTSGDKSAVLATLNDDLGGMKSLSVKIAADTTRAQAAADYRTIFTTYRVYAVALPQSRYTAAADTLSSTAVPRLTDAQHRLSALLTGKDSSKSTSALRDDLADMDSEIVKASASLSELSARLLAITPAQYNADHGVLSAPRQSLISARTALKQARQDAKTIVSALKK